MLEQQTRPSLPERASATAGGLFERFPASSSIIAATVAVIATNVLLRPRFESNDDVSMMFIADGTTFGEPSEHLVFTNVVIGKMLAGLYSITTGVTWYSLYLYAALAASFAVMLFLFATGPRMARRNAVVVGSAVFVVTLHSWMNLQFTTTAAVLASAGAMLYVFGRDETSLRLPLLGGLLAGVATMIRFEGALFPLVVFAPFLVVAAIGRGGRRLAAFVVPVVLIAGGSYLYSASVYSDSAWTDFFEWNSHRALLHDTPRLDDPAEDIEALEAVGWSVNDAEIFNRWMVFDENTFSDEAVQTVGELTSPGFDPLGLAWTIGLSGFLQFGVCLVALMVAVVLFGSASRRDRLLFASMLALAAMALTYLLVTAKLPVRVTLPLLSLSIMVGGLVIQRAPQPLPRAVPAGTPRWRRNAVPAIALGTAVAVLAASAFVWGPRSDSDAQVLYDNLEEIESFDPDGVYVLWVVGAPLAFETIGPFDSRRTDLELVNVGWLIRSPLQSSQLEALGIEDVMAAIVQRPDVYVVMPNPAEVDNAQELFQQYLDEHDIDGELVPLLSSGMLNVYGGAD